MGRVAQVLASERVHDDTGHGADIKADPGGGDLVIVPLFATAGADALPLPGDSVALDDSSGSGGEHATGFADTRNSGKALPGEARFYSRSSNGDVKVEFWLRADGSLQVGNGAGAIVMEPGGDVVINGVRISKSGAVSAPANISTGGSMLADGEVTAVAKGTPIALSKHYHLSAAPTSPTSTPLPGPPPPPPVP
jgi:hypothetical protein